MATDIWSAAREGETGAEHECDGKASGGALFSGDNAAVAAVTGIYVSAELFMLSDNSPEFQETWRFLDQRMGELDSWESGGMPAPNAQQLQDVAYAFATGGLAIVSALPSILARSPDPMD